MIVLLLAVSALLQNHAESHWDWFAICTNSLSMGRGAETGSLNGDLLAYPAAASLPLGIGQGRNNELKT